MCDITTYSARVSYPRTTSARLPVQQEICKACHAPCITKQHGAWILESRKPGHTFGIRNKHRHKAGSPVGDLDGEISLLVLELVDPNRLPRRISHTCQCKAQQQSNGEWANSSHCVTMLAQSSVERRTLQDERRNRCIYADG